VKIASRKIATLTDQIVRVTLTPMRTISVVGLPNEEFAAWTASLENDGGAFAVVFDLHRDRIYRHALRMTTNTHDAEDVVAVTFFELWRRRKSVRLVDGSVLPWLLVTATNVSRNVTRGIRRYRALIATLPRATEMQSSEDAALETIAELGLAANVREAMGSLSPADAALIALTAFERYSPTQAAIALGITEGAARTRLHRARARMATVLGTLEDNVNINATKETSP
jgi:RNA polymerase sigma-70 factor (ECF subfamily)